MAAWVGRWRGVGRQMSTGPFPSAPRQTVHDTFTSYGFLSDDLRGRTNNIHAAIGNGHMTLIRSLYVKLGTAPSLREGDSGLYNSRS